MEREYVRMRDDWKEIEIGGDDDEEDNEEDDGEDDGEVEGGEEVVFQ